MHLKRSSPSLLAKSPQRLLLAVSMWSPPTFALTPGDWEMAYEYVTVDVVTNTPSSVHLYWFGLICFFACEEHHPGSTLRTNSSTNCFHPIFPWLFSCDLWDIWVGMHSIHLWRHILEGLRTDPMIAFCKMIGVGKPVFQKATVYITVDTLISKLILTRGRSLAPSLPLLANRDAVAKSLKLPLRL